MLKTVADHVYPPKGEPVQCDDDKQRDLSDDKYKNRLLQFISEASKGTASQALLGDQIESLENRLNNTYDLMGKGVHGSVSTEEAE